MTRFLERRRASRCALPSDGLSGLDLAKFPALPRVILLDVMMPGMDGWSVLNSVEI